MKKLLALVLALVMSMSLVTISNAAFSDADKIDHKEAVDVMNALGVINGMPDGSFAPAGNVTRAEMAKMISIISLGNVDAAAFIGTTTDLTDITGHWAEGFIKYCYSQGVIAGRGDGTFAPNANVTAVEAAKMLLVAIGYNASVQEYVGADWQINVTRDAQISKFFDELSVNANKVLTRDEAAQMIYNAIQAKTIVKTSSVDRKDGSITDMYNATGAKLLYKTFEAQTWVGTYAGNYDNSAANNKGEIAVVGKLDTAEANVVKTKASFPSDMSITNIGEEVKVIFKDGKGGVANKPDKKDTIYGVYNTGATQVVTAVMNDIKDQKSSDAKINIGGTKYDTKNSVEVFYNYQAGSVTKAANNGNSGANSALTTLLKQQTNDTLKFVVDDEDGKIEAVYVTEYMITNVTAVTSTKVTLKGVGTLTIADHDIYSGIAKDDVVVYNWLYDADKDDAKFVVTKAETVEGKLEGFKYDGGVYNNVVVNGTTYPIDTPAATLISVSDDSYSTLAGSNIGDTVKVYLLNGMAGAIDKVAGDSTYAVITDKDVSGTLGSDLTPWKVVLMLADGTKVTKIIHKDSTETPAASGSPAVALTSAKVVAGNLVKYTLSGDDKVKITEVSTSTYTVGATPTGADVYNATTKKITTGASATKAVASDAVLYVKVGSSFYAYNLRSAKDIKATGTAGTNDVTVNYMTNSDGLVIAAYMALSAKPGTSTNNTVYGIVKAYNGTREIENDTYYQYVVAVDDNEDNDIVVNLSTSSLSTGDLVSFEMDTKGLYNGAAASGKDIVIVSGTAAAVKKFDAANLLITYYTGTSRANANSEYVGSSLNATTLDKDYKVIYVDKDGKKGGENIGVNAFDGTTGYANAILLDKDSDGLVDVIFVETSGKVNMGGAGFGATTTVTLTNSNTTIGASAGVNGAYTVGLSTTTPEVGATFTVTVTCTSVDAANTNGERVTVTYDGTSKTLDFTAAGTKTVTFTATATGSVSAAVAKIV